MAQPLGRLLPRHAGCQGSVFPAAGIRPGWVGDPPGLHGAGQAALGSLKARTLCIASAQDQCWPPPDIAADLKASPNARAAWIDSVAGHLSCGNGAPQATWGMGEAIGGFLQELSAQRQGVR